MKNIVLFGAGGFARETAYLIERINHVKPTYELLGFIVDDAYYRDGLEINGYPVLGTRQWLLAHKNEVVCTCAIGEPGPREAIQEELEQNGIRFETLISPDVELHDTVKIGNGSVIAHGVMMTVNIKIGKGVVINGCTTLGHDAEIGDYACVMGGCGLAGYVKIGRRVKIGGRAFIVPHISVGDDAVIAAGSAVFARVRSGRRVLGNPAKRFEV